MVLRLALAAMGTRFELVLIPAEGEAASGASSSTLRAIGEEAFEEIREAEARLSLFDKASLLSHVNRNAHAGWVRVDDDMFELLKLCSRVHAETNGAFDPTVAPLMAARGFHGAQGHGRETLPEEAALEALSFEAVELEARGSRVRFTHPDVALDLGGIAKGHGLDLATRTLREAGVTQALLHGGTSSVVALGTPPGAAAGQRGWRIGLGEEAPAGGSARVAELVDEALSISEPTGRVTRSGEGHVLDPRTGRSAVSASMTAVRCVLASTDQPAALSDAGATALVVDPSLSEPPELSLEAITPPSSA